MGCLRPAGAGLDAQALQGLADIGARLDQYGLHPGCPGTVDVRRGVIEEQDLGDLKAGSSRDNAGASGSGLRRPRSDETKTERKTDSSDAKRPAHALWCVGFEFVNV